MSLYSSLLRPALFSLDPEQAHDLVLGTLRRPWVQTALSMGTPHPDARLRTTVCGLAFENPLGLAAGLDKQAVALGAWAALGFGAVEVGTVTPRPQPGNPRPRLFRLPEDRALINRFGFNSLGASQVAHNLARQQAGRLQVGVNIGKNKDTPNARAVDDYLAAVETLHRHAGYFVINVSSPNTAGLRDLQHAAELGELVGQVVRRVQALTAGRTCPVLVKLSPDMPEASLFDAVDAALDAGAAGIIATNTTLGREGLRADATTVAQAGGLSGAPLRSAADSVCRRLFTHVRGRAPIVGVGGIGNAADAYARIRAGASLVQIYTALIYEGPTLVHDILRGLADRLDRDGFSRLEEAIGIDAR